MVMDGWILKSYQTECSVDANGNPTSTGVHLHFGVRYQNHGYSHISELSKAIMEGLLFKSYQTECSVGVPIDWIRYYRSGNLVY